MSEHWISDAARAALWFSAKLRFELKREGSEGREYEDRIYLFQCPDPESAATKASEIGRLQEHEYSTEAGDQLTWRLVEVLNVTMTFLDTPLDRGIEIYSERVTRSVLSGTPATSSPQSASDHSAGGRHLGSANPETEAMTKPPVPDRRIGNE